MEITLSINTDSCIRCGKCVKVCPANIFVQDKTNQTVQPVHIDTCIACGHCVAVCPTSAIIHPEFPPEKVHPFDYTELPSPEQMMLLCKARRSNRAFSDRPVPEENFGMILEAAHRAPTASNMQQVGFTLITDPEKLRMISDFTIGIFNSKLKTLQNPVLKPLLKYIVPDIYKLIPSFERLKQEYALGNDLILRRAKAAIFIHTPPSSRFGCEDSNLAYQNGSLMAECLGVSQFYMGFVLAATKQDKSNGLNKILGINGKIHSAMALGMPSFRYPNYIDRKDMEINN